MKVNLAFTYWYGIAAPKELPADLKKTLAEGFKTMIADPEFTTSLENIGLQTDYLNPDESEQKWLNDSQELSTDIQETGIIDLIKSQKQ